MSRVLIVEDNEMNRDMLSRRLERRGYSVITASEGTQAVRVAKNEQPDLILMDIGLPGMDGWEVTRILKSQEETRRIPIIVLTAHVMPADRTKAFDAGCDDFDTKPVEFERLRGKIEHLLSEVSVP